MFVRRVSDATLSNANDFYYVLYLYHVRNENLNLLCSKRRLDYLNLHTMYTTTFFSIFIFEYVFGSSFFHYILVFCKYIMYVFMYTEISTMFFISFLIRLRSMNLV